jgi:Domain of unknown function (DUF5916)
MPGRRSSLPAHLPRFQALPGAVAALPVLLLVNMLAPAALSAQGKSSVHPVPPRVVHAERLTGQIEVDGRLDEPAWRSAQPATGFTQSEPHEGEPATQHTQVWFLYDDDALYIGARMYDTKGEAGVVTRLARRDDDVSGDDLSIALDTYHDHLSEVLFTINPSGVKGDASGLGGTGLDPSWDPVWQASTRIDSLGWTAEIRIPFSQLRFAADSVQTWGVDIFRVESRLHEHSSWAFWPLSAQGGPAWYGHLDGVQVPDHLARTELLPYLVGRGSYLASTPSGDPFRKPQDYTYRAGLDLDYRLAPNLTLTATANPDFGQVEVDPAVVNLSAFETYFPEKRPFFVEGGGYFDYGGFWCKFCSNASSLTLFYSRRIGRAPQGGDLAHAAGSYADVPESTTILGAAKVAGRTGGGLSVGVLDAVTKRETAEVIGSNGPFGMTVEPPTNYFVGRFKQDLAGGNLVVGGIVTSVLRDLSSPTMADLLDRNAETAGLDAEAWWGRKTYHLMAQLAFSDIGGDTAAILRAQTASARYFQRPDRGQGAGGFLSDAFDPSATSLRGYAGYARLAKDAGNWQWETAFSVRSPSFESNDLGFLTRADYLWMSGNIVRAFTRPGSWYRSIWLDAGGQQQFNFDGALTSRQLQLFGQVQLLNYWNVSAFLIHRPATLDDQLTRGGPLVRTYGVDFYSASISSDSRRSLVLGLNADYAAPDTVSPFSYDVGVSLTYHPVSNISLSLGPAFSRSGSSHQYVTTVADPTATRFYGHRYVFADLVENTLSMETRLNVTFTPTLSLELYAQPLIAGAAYSRFKEFVAPGQEAQRVYGRNMGTITADSTSTTFTVDPDGAGPAQSFSFSNPNFNFRSLRGNAVLRWEYRPGSTIYLVWTQDRSDTGPQGDLALDRDRRALFKAAPDNIFLIKVSYWLGF